MMSDRRQSKAVIAVSQSSKPLPDEVVFGDEGDEVNMLKKRAYYNALQAEIDGGGAGAYARHLMRFAETDQYRGIDLRFPPMTASKIDILLKSLPKEKEWIMDVAVQGRFSYLNSQGDRQGVSLRSDGPTRVAAEAVHGSAEPHFRTYGSPRGLATAVGTFLRRRDQTLYDRKGRWADLDNGNTEDRPYHYEFPPLAEFRRRVAKLLKVPVQCLQDGDRMDHPGGCKLGNLRVMPRAA